MARSASAGTLRRGPFLRPHPPSQPPSGRAATASRPQAKASHASPPQARGDSSRIPVPSNAPANRGYDSSAYTTPAAPQATDSGASSTKSELQNSAVYDTNGMRLDRTPTDDEINWLWDKVRTCLHRDSSSSSIAPEQNPRQSSQATQNGHAVRQQQQHRANNRLNNTFQNNYMGTGLPARRKVSMETLNNYANRRSSLLSQRRQQQPHIGTISYHMATDEAIQPIQSTTTPNATNTTFSDQDGEW